MIAHRTAATTGHAERGATLVVLLVTIVFVSVMFSALLNYQSTALSAQTALAKRRNLDLAADSALDVGIAQLQKNATWGTASGQCAGTAAPGQTMATWRDPDANTDVTVSCYREAVSGGTEPRSVHLLARQGTSTIASADVKIYDLDGQAFVSTTRWERMT